MKSLCEHPNAATIFIRVICDIRGFIFADRFQSDL